MHALTTALSNDDLLRSAPSIFAEDKRPDRSERYAFIPTINVIDGLRSEGWEPTKAMQSRSRLEGNREFAKHMIRFRRHDARPMVGDNIPELVLVNSHDGASGFNLMAGVFRLVCSNGMVVGNVSDKLSVRHTGNAVDNVIEGSYSIIERLPKIADFVERAQAIQLAPREQTALAEAALAIRWEGDESPISADALLRPRRYADNTPDLWATFNRVQENMVKGGVRGLTVDANGRARRTSTRAIKSVSEDVRVNRALWTLAERMAEIKAA